MQLGTLDLTLAFSVCQYEANQVTRVIEPLVATIDIMRKSSFLMGLMGDTTSMINKCFFIQTVERKVYFALER